MVLFIAYSVFCRRAFNSSCRNTGSFGHLRELSNPTSRPYHSPCSLPMCYSPLTPPLSRPQNVQLHSSNGLHSQLHPFPLLHHHLLKTSPKRLCNSKAKNNFFPSILLFRVLRLTDTEHSLGLRDGVQIKLNLGNNYSFPLWKSHTGKDCILSPLSGLPSHSKGGERMYQCLSRTREASCYFFI